jgi:hypothetical protein
MTGPLAPAPVFLDRFKIRCRLLESSMLSRQPTNFDGPLVRLLAKVERFGQYAKRMFCTEN